jgi:hypothetical protein
MRHWTSGFAALALAACLPAAQEGGRQLSTYVFDGGGGRQLWGEQIAGAGRRLERRRDLNGRWTPSEQVEERVVRSDAAGRVVERTVRRFSPDGRPLPAERIVIEEAALGGGRSVTTTRVLRGDLNGRMEVYEVAVAESRTAGDATHTTTNVERRGVSGRMEIVERRLGTATTSEGTSVTSEALLERDPNGRFVETARVAATRTERGGRSEETREEFRIVSGSVPVLVRRSVERASRTPGGAVREVDVFGPAAPGRAAGPDLQLRERQVYESAAAPDGSVTEVFSIRRPALTSTRELGPLQKISETVCRGQCAPPANK